MSEKIEVENINVPGHKSRVDKQKYLAMRQAMLDTLASSDQPLTHDQMVDALIPTLPQDLWPDGKKVTWWSKTVQLDLEAKGLIKRDPTAKPLQWAIA